MLLSELKLAWSLTLLILPLGAQSYREQEKAPLSAALWANSPAFVIDRTNVQPAPSRTISVELLRDPPSSPALHMLQKAQRTSEAGDHLGALKLLLKTLAKFPGTGAYVYSMLGVEYLKTGRLPDAVDALEQAVTFLPHDASNHANLGFALVCKGQYDRAEPELRRALDLDPHNVVASQLVNELEVARNTRK